jgi:hypothetical protein
MVELLMKAQLGAITQSNISAEIGMRDHNMHIILNPVKSGDR